MRVSIKAGCHEIVAAKVRYLPMNKEHMVNVRSVRSICDLLVGIQTFESMWLSNWMVTR